MNETIISNILHLMDQGHSLDNIIVNDGNERCGDDCAVSRQQWDEMRQTWRDESDDDDDYEDIELPTATEWLNENNINIEDQQKYIITRNESGNTLTSTQSRSGPGIGR